MHPRSTHPHTRPAEVRRLEKRFAAFAAGPVRAALIALVALATATASTRAPAETVVRKVSGTVEIGRGEPPQWQPLVLGARVEPAERVRTGADGRVELAVDAGTLRVHENSLLTLPPAEAGLDRVELEAGYSLFDVLRREGHRFEVRTPTVVVSVKGTRFGVETGGEVGAVTVYRGVVGVHPADASEIVEALVREGFVATGGIDLPVELEVAPEGDPWSAWDDAGARAGERSQRTPREAEVERARRSARQATDADVVKHAVARRPELVERLRGRTDENDAGLRGDGANGAPPASPADLDLGDSIGRLGDTVAGTGDTLLGGALDAQRQILDAQRAEDALASLLATVDVEGITAGALFPNGQTTPTLADLEGYAVRDIVLLTEALESMAAASASAPSPWSPTDVTAFIENDLVQQGGMPVEAASRLVQLLFGQ